MFKKNIVNYVEYIESDEYFQINGKGAFKWVRITNPSENICDEDYYIKGHYAYIAGNKTHTNGIDCGSIDIIELNRLKKLSKRNKKISFKNPVIINIAILGLIFAGINTLVNIMNYFK